MRIPRPRPAGSVDDAAGADLDDAALFRRLVGPVREMARTAQAPAPTPPPAEALQFERDEAAVRAELLYHAFDPASIEVGEEIHYLKPDQPARVLKRLRRGQYSVRAELDLHQMTAPVAREAIRLFLDEAIRHGEACVRIVHGKGLGSSARGPVLKGLTEQILRRRGDVVAFSSALPALGGTGAVLVLLDTR
ncbi:MAG: Smr/MutS family protein [Xanthomonadales bacterium]|nr:Smr/MutS family protein [Xanthomonadales bacterium]